MDQDFGKLTGDMFPCMGAYRDAIAIAEQRIPIIPILQHLNDGRRESVKGSDF
jgi:hypothetical protein